MEIPQGPVLDRVDLPEDLRKLGMDELYRLADEIRLKIVQTVSRTGGHLASRWGPSN